MLEIMTFSSFNFLYYWFQTFALLILFYLSFLMQLLLVINNLYKRNLSQEEKEHLVLIYQFVKKL